MTMPVDPWFIPPPVKPTRVEFNSYVDRFKALLADAVNVPAVDHLVSVNSPVTERSDFLNSCRLQIKAATEMRRADLMRVMPGEADETDARSKELLDRVLECKSKREAREVNKDVKYLELGKWLAANAPERYATISVQMRAHVTALPE
jgi:hypothetical protein